MFRDVTPNVDSEKQDEADKSEGGTQAKHELSPAPVLDLVADDVRVHMPKLHRVQSDVDCGPPVVGADLDAIGPCVAYHIVAAKMRLAAEQTCGHALPTCCQESVSWRLNRYRSFDCGHHTHVVTQRDLFSVNPWD